MQQQLTLKLLPNEAADESIIKQYIAQTVANSNVNGFHILKSSIDARGKTIWINLTVKAFINEPFVPREILLFYFKDVKKANKKVIIIGAGPAGLFAALKLIEAGIKPIILERGKDVRSRRRDLAILNKEGIVNPESNYCFGEGGAGTYSDGKLYTRSNKRGDIDRILNLFVHFGAEEKILYEAHPHIGTNKLPHIITAMRKQIEDCGGDFLFEKKVVDFIINNNRITGVKTADGNSFEANAVILATGHSARDIFSLLHEKKILIEAKPFALGVRIEHPQSLIDSAQYHCSIRDANLPPASYSLVQQIDGKGVFSFCMCPGGIIAPAATNPGELVVNGWSPSKRNNAFANSGMVVSVEIEDALKHLKISRFENLNIDKGNPLLMMHFQQMVEQKAFQYGGGKFVAPAQRMIDFTEKNTSASLPDCSYLPGIHSSPLNEVLPPFVYNGLKEAFKEFGKKMKGYYTNEAVVVATESRTSSPVRIPRDKETFQHPQIQNLYPCGEGAGYAGGIVSAAMDGERVATQITSLLIRP
ncbi:MAG: FAD-binding protein [Sphingobacteriales bacterium]|nr:FAD-binding protein [Sphingobacteriales bacterium]MBI3717482.1 FAD-binding protein [Sphingobacteriales bacterium]